MTGDRRQFASDIVPAFGRPWPGRIAATRLMLRRTGAMDWPSDLRQTALA
jgi:hypothetical protein